MKVTARENHWPRRRAASSRTLLFARNFFKHPQWLGSIVPSSRFLVKRMLSRIDWQRAGVIVEYGPGIGNITQEILKRMRPDSVLVAIELNPEFVTFLRREVPDPRLRVVCGSASDVRSVLRQFDLPHADYIISGIPYTTLPEDIRGAILRESHGLLHPEGAFVVYQFTRAVLPSLRRTFARVQQDFELRNILPARLFFCTR